MTKKKKQSPEPVIPEHIPNEDIRDQWTVQKKVEVKPDEIFNPDDWHSFPFVNRNGQKAL